MAVLCTNGIEVQRSDSDGQARVDSLRVSEVLKYNILWLFGTQCNTPTPIIVDMALDKARYESAYFVSHLQHHVRAAAGETSLYCTLWFDGPMAGRELYLVTKCGRRMGDRARRRNLLVSA